MGDYKYMALAAACNALHATLSALEDDFEPLSDDMDRKLGEQIEEVSEALFDICQKLTMLQIESLEACESKEAKDEALGMRRLMLKGS